MPSQLTTFEPALTVGWLVKDFADGWISCRTQAEAELEAQSAGNTIKPLTITLIDDRRWSREYRVDGPRGYCRFTLDADRRRLGSFGGETWPFAYPEIFEPRDVFGKAITDPAAVKALRLASPHWGYFVRDEIALPQAETV